MATVTAGAGWDLPIPEVTVDAAGGAQFRVTCLVARPADLVITAGEARPASPCPPARRASTPPTTTEPIDEPDADFAVGSTFTPPFAGPLPAGTWVVDAPRLRGRVRGVGGRRLEPRPPHRHGHRALVLDTFARNLETVGGAPPATYERTA